MAFNHNQNFVPTNTMDRWILSFTQSLILFVKEEMKSELHKLVSIVFYFDIL